ncbi:MAG: biotin--[acetyl-CoA-carboxylase] ligase [Gammaproteobacteria bacterium]|nr:biotin--[acetyl-CoA-carboxylase] ligase [Gammaproteobacteria bacterium]
MNEYQIKNIRTLAAGSALPGTDELRQTIEELGLSYATRDGEIRLIDPPELLDAEIVRSGLGDGAGLLDRLDVHFTIDSTNTWQLGRAGQSDFHPACLAERQEAGKGRRGRHWVKPFGRNIYMSVGWEIPRARSVSGLSLAVGMVIAGVLRDAGLVEVGLKWPNDVNIETEASLRGFWLRWQRRRPIGTGS